jgi:hypothetical protein
VPKMAQHLKTNPCRKLAGRGMAIVSQSGPLKDGGLLAR